eukprot:6855942-Ditylum_brightwellii.AAC.1
MLEKNVKKIATTEKKRKMRGKKRKKKKKLSTSILVIRISFRFPLQMYACLEVEVPNKDSSTFKKNTRIKNKIQKDAQEMILDAMAKEKRYSIQLA